MAEDDIVQLIDDPRERPAEEGPRFVELRVDGTPAALEHQCEAAGPEQVDRNGREIGRHLGAVKWDSPQVMERLQRAMTAE